MTERKLKFDTLQVHAGQKPDPATGASAVPIYQTTSYVFHNVEHAENLFSFKELGYMYTRAMNPTTDVLEQRIAALECGIGALAVASGTAAITYSILNVAGVGDEIVAANSIYGGISNLFTVTLPRFGIHTVFVDPEDPENFRKAINERTKAVYIEAIGNPGMNIIDIEEVAKIAHEHGVPLIIDSTFGNPYLIRPIEFGADIVVHSAGKYIGGHGTSLGGVIVDSGRFDWVGSGRFPGLTECDPSLNQSKYTEVFGPYAYIAKTRAQILNDTGAAISPFNSFLLLQGLETLSLRVEKQVSNTRKVVEFLQKHPLVSWVNYPSCKDNKYYKLAEKYFPKGAGAVFTFGIKGGMEEVRTFIDNLEIFTHLSNVGDTKSLVIHPATTTYLHMSQEKQKACSVSIDQIRLSIGIEDPEDMIYDLDQALRKAVKI